MVLVKTHGRCFLGSLFLFHLVNEARFIMKRSIFIGLSSALLVAGGAIAKDMPAKAWPALNQLFASKPAPQSAQLSPQQQQQPRQQSQQESQLQLQLSAAKRVEANGKTSWQESGSKVTARPGDVLRYTLKGANQGKKSLSNLVLTQPLPQGMVYQLGTASNPGGERSYSIDGGKSYSAKPMVTVTLANGKTEQRPAPAESYSHIKWQLSQSLAAGNSVDLSYEVRVR
jgi:uncharacterized repeat protein (TIGR01451 family)